jgi:hypothetical protein
MWLLELGQQVDYQFGGTQIGWRAVADDASPELLFETNAAAGRPI